MLLDPIASGRRYKSGRALGTAGESTPNIRLCHLCQKRKQQMENPLPERMERELQKLALWDQPSAERQRQKMLAIYKSR